MESSSLAQIDKEAMVKVQELQHKTNDELVSMYAEQAMKPFPSLVITKALETMFKNRKINNVQPKGVRVIFTYYDSEGNEKAVQVVSNRRIE